MISSNTDFDTEVTLETQSRPLPEDPPFRILFLGNWSGRDDTVFSELIQPRPLPVDRDNFDDVLAKLNVRLSLDFGQNGQDSLSLRFKELDDFHPDRIFEQVPLFSDLRDIRNRLLVESSFTDAAFEARRLFLEDVPKEVVEDALRLPEQEIPSAESGGGLLEHILSQPSGGTPLIRSQTSESRELSSFLRNIVRPHIVETDETEQVRLLNLVDQTSSELMRSILHHPKFQELESAWRGVYLLIRKIETDNDLKINLLDISKEEVSDNLRAISKLADSDIYKWLVRDAIDTPGAEPWSLVCGNFTFDVNIDDVAALIRIAKICETANAPFISHVSPKMFGISSLNTAKGFSDWIVDQESGVSKLWDTIRSMPEARFLGLVMPRYLARLPYGAATDPTETFAFEEFKEVTEHENYLWSNPSFVCSLLLAQTYRMYGWQMSQGFQLCLSDLPTHIFEDDGETRTKPCAEILMTEEICQVLLDAGLMPLISYKNSDRVQLGRFQSIAFPPRPLAGRWS